VRYVEYHNRNALLLVSGNTVYDATLRTTWRYATVPALLEYRLKPGRAPFLVGGCEAGFLIDVSQQWDVSSSIPSPFSADARLAAVPASQIYEEVSAENAIDLYHRADLALVGGVGVRLPMRGHDLLALLRYHHGMVNIVRLGSLDQRTRGFEALFGYRW
jgi:hypothetical protein